MVKSGMESKMDILLESNNSIENQNTNNDKPEQVSRAFLRENFLKTMNYLNGNNCTISTREYSTVTCKYKTCDADFENIAVEDLKTPSGHVLPKAILRVNDIISMTFELPTD